MAKCSNQIPNQVMRQRTRRLDSLLLEGDRCGFGLADPDRQVPVAVGLAQQQHRLVLRLLDANADDANFTHLCLPSARAAVSKIRPAPTERCKHQAAERKLCPKSSTSAVQNVAHC